MHALIRIRRHHSLGIGLVAVLASAWAQEAGPRVTPELLRSRIAAVQDSTELDEATRTRLLDLHRRSLGNLEAARANDEAIEEYRRAGREAPAETERIREALERRRGSDPLERLGSLSTFSVERLSGLLGEETANRTAVEAKLAVMEARLEIAAQRPAEARARIADARALIGDLASRSREPASRDETAQLAEARRWADETRLEALRTEISMLDQELLSHNVRVELLKARRDEALLGVRRIGERVDALRAALSERRRAEAEAAMSQARAALAGDLGDVPLVRELAQANLALVELIPEQLAEMDELEARERAWPRTSQIESAHRNARRKLELAGSRAPVGMAILAERHRLPGSREYASKRRRLSRAITDVSLRLADSEEERQSLTDLDAYLDARMAGASGEAVEPEVRAALEGLVATRRSLLERATANDTALQRRLYELDDELRRLTESMGEYEEFLAERLLWVRSTWALGLSSLARLPDEVAEYVASGPWVETARTAAIRLVRAPVSLALLLLALLLVWRRRRIRASLQESGRSVGHLAEDSMKGTFRALALTLLLAAPSPLVLAAIGGALWRPGEAGWFPAEVGSALLRAAAWLVLPVTVHALCLPGGLANRHFGWSDRVVARLRRQLAWFIGLVFPIFLVLRTAQAAAAPSSTGSVLVFLCFAAVLAGLIALIAGMGHPTKGTIAQLVAARSEGARWPWWWQRLGFPLAILLPSALMVLGFLGFAFTAQEMVRRVYQSIWALALVWLGAAFARRWLLLTGRRLADREPGAANGDEGGLGGEPADLRVLGAESQKLLNAIVVLVSALVLLGIWAEVVPALGILESVELWSHTRMIGGVEQSAAVTLLDLLLAVVLGVVGFLLARHVPSLLDIILLKQGGVTPSARYTTGTLARYAISAATVLVVLRHLGASTAQLGWAAAALGVGIGFGLQEIVANFICGLILLFERPVRVGDVITIGDASGEVTKIRIRATTIRDWEEKELVVPNKELITGRLLNWTLSNSVIRVFIAVGVAYGSDVEKAMDLIHDAADECDLVLEDPAPRVHFEQFGDSSLQLTLRAYTSSVLDRLSAATELHRAIDRKFREAGIVIAFPQRDVHLHAGERSGGTPPPAPAR